MAIVHNNGWKIQKITGVGHETYKGVANWYFIADIILSDGGRIEDETIPPHALAMEDETDKPELTALMDKLNTYLGEAGEWHDDKHKRDGRIYRWTPKKAIGSQRFDGGTYDL